MENASKALIIAGAILLAILIISLGIMIYTQASGVVNSNGMSEVEISTFNNKFIQYEGENIRGANVNSMINAVISNNQAALNAGEDNKLIDIVVSGSGITVATASQNSKTYVKSVSAKAQTGKVYKVEITGYGTTGLVNQITISNPR